MGGAWFEVIAQYFNPKPVQPFWIVIVAGIAWAGLAFALFIRWSSRKAWSEVHGFAAAIGATLACAATPYLTIATWPKIDVIGKLIFDVLAVVGALLLARSVLRRKKTADIQEASN
jgi:FtsH-binding integral membrane protein